MTKFLTRTLLSLIVLTLLTLTSCKKAEELSTAAEPVAQQVEAESWEKFVSQQIEAHVEAHPQWAVVQGRHEFDGQLPDWSRAGIEKEIARLHQVRKEAMAFADDQMSSEQLYQREYLVSRVDQDIFWMESRPAVS